MGLKGSSLYAAMQSLHAIRWIAGLVKFGQKANYKDFPLSKKSSWYFLELLSAYDTLTKFW